MGGESTAELLDLEIGIVNTNNAELLRTCLGSLKAACGGLRWRVTVLDNACTDGSGEMLESEFPWVAVIRNETRVGYAVTLNQLLATVLSTKSARYVALVHEDVEFDPRSLETLVRDCAADPTVGLAGPSIRDGEGQPQPSFQAFPTFGREVFMAFVQGSGRPPASGTGWLDGPCLLFPVEALARIGPFDERFFIFFEDVDISLRTHQAGLKVWQDPDCWLTHRRHGSTAQKEVAGRMELQIMRSRFLYFQKHHGTAQAISLAWLLRLALWLRAGKARVIGRIRADPDEARLGRVLTQLARSNPRKTLPHELRDPAT